MKIWIQENGIEFFITENSTGKIIGAKVKRYRDDWRGVYVKQGLVKKDRKLIVSFNKEENEAIKKPPVWVALRYKVKDYAFDNENKETILRQGLI